MNNVVQIPKDATNGDVLKALFPNVKIVRNVSHKIQTIEISDEWWNDKYIEENKQ